MKIIEILNKIFYMIYYRLSIYNFFYILSLVYFGLKLHLILLKYIFFCSKEISIKTNSQS